MHSQASECHCVPGKWTNLIWMVKTVLYLGLIRIDENLVDVGCFPLLYATSSPMAVLTVLHTMLSGGRQTDHGLPFG